MTAEGVTYYAFLLLYLMISIHQQHVAQFPRFKSTTLKLNWFSSILDFACPNEIPVAVNYNNLSESMTICDTIF